MEEIEKGLAVINKCFKELDQLGGLFDAPKKAEIAEKAARNAYGVSLHMYAELKRISEALERIEDEQDLGLDKLGGSA